MCEELAQPRAASSSDGSASGQPLFVMNPTSFSPAIGGHHLYRTIVFEYNSPLRNFGEQIRLGTLEEAACRQLATSQ
jgi:hypothetical protein